MSLGLLMLGFVIGMRHAMESDHLAAMASLATRSRSMQETVWQGAVWGMGHTITLIIFGALVLLLDAVIPESLARALEFMVGLMLVGLGFDVLRRLVRDRIHFHVHRHDDGASHFHAHSHAGDTGHPTVHQHKHKHAFPTRALLVGIMHGMAGSAALILLTFQTAHSPLAGILYIALFGFGSIAGMAVLSMIIAVPLHYSATGLTWLHNGLQAVAGSVTLIVGSVMIYEIASVSLVFA